MAMSFMREARPVNPRGPGGRAGRLAIPAIAFLPFCAPAMAGQMYGTISDPDHGLIPKLEFTVQCAGSTVRGSTDDRGSYRVLVPQRGRCNFSVSRPGDPGSVVLSYQNPVQYDFLLVRRADGAFELQRR